MEVFENNGAPKSSILVRFSIINHPFWGTPVFGNTHVFGVSASRSATLSYVFWLHMGMGWGGVGDDDVTFLAH